MADEKSALFARGALRALVDPGAFDEAAVIAAGRAVATRARIAGRRAVAFALEGGGPLSGAEAEVMARVAEHARSHGTPIVGIDPSLAPDGRAGLEGVAALESVARHLLWLEGHVPRIAVVTDPSSMAAGAGIGAFDVIVATEAADAADDSAHIVAPDPSGAIAVARGLMTLLPSSSRRGDALFFENDGGDVELDPDVVALLDAHGPFDVRRLVHAVCDDGAFVELDGRSGPAIVVGLGRVVGQTIGFIADQPTREVSIDLPALAKAEALARLCDRLQLPIVSFVDSGEIATQRAVLDLKNLPSTAGTARAAGALLSARAGRTASLSIVLRRAQDAGLLLSAALRPHHAVIALEGARIGPDGGDVSAEDAYRGRWLKKVVTPGRLVEQIVHWIRWSRSERQRSLDPLPDGDPRAFRLSGPR